MRLSVLAVLVAVVVGVSSAIAAPPPGKGKPASPGKSATKGKPTTTGPMCKPMVSVVLKGTLTSTSTSALGMNVSHANRWGRSWATAGTAIVTVTGTTKVRRQGQKLLTDLVAGDRVLVQARACKADLMSQTLPALTVVRVVAHPAKPVKA